MRLRHMNDRHCDLPTQIDTLSRETAESLLKPNTDVSDLNEALQKALDDLGPEVVLNAMFTEGIESTSQIIFWELA